MGNWDRTCSCTVEHWVDLSTSTTAAAPDLAMHRHEQGCTALAVAKQDPTGGTWFTRCGSCETTTRLVAVTREDPEYVESLAWSVW